MRKKITQTLATALFLSFLGPMIVFAQEVAAPSELVGAIKRITDMLKILGAIITVIFVMVGGYKFLTAGGSEEKVAEARKSILWALVGLGVILLAQVLIGIACWVGTGSWTCPTFK